MRLFIAINFPEAIKDALLDAVKQLRQQGAAGNFTRRENLHLTLAFIGESQRLPELRQILDQLEAAPFPLKLSRAGNFSDLYWVGLQKSHPLEQLAEQLRRALLDQGFAIDRKPFRPHITIARQVQADQPLQLSITPAAMEVERVSLMCSERIQGKLTYTELHARAL